MKKIIVIVLRALAHYKISRIKPVIIGVTGSYGKTTTKEVIAAVLSKKYAVLKSEKSLNTDIGMCLAILQQPSGFSSVGAWTRILCKGFLNAVYSRKVDFFVLEYGVDAPGDMDLLLKIARPTVAVITAIAPAHQADGQFKNIHEIAHEKGKLASSVSEKGLVILNHQNEYVRNSATTVKSKISWYNNEKSLHATATQSHAGITAKLFINKKPYDFFMPVIGKFHADCVQVAVLIAHTFDVSPSLLKEALKEFVPPPGRMSLLEGVNGSTIIDSSYNASPETVKNALGILKQFPAKRRIAVLGSMNELGAETEKAHREIGQACGSWLDVLITVGESAKTIASECLKQGSKPSTITSFNTATEASEYLLKTGRLKATDVLLVKGSQNKVRLERTVKAIMAHPEKAHDLLCRQEPEWLAKE